MTSSTAGGPVLGRYARDTTDDGDIRTVRLLAMPVALLMRAREHHDELIREFTLMAIRGSSSGAVLPPRLRELVDILGRRFGASTSRADMERDAALERGDVTVDLTYHVPASFADDITMLGQLMDDADTFCRMEKLLTLPRDATMVSFGHWYTMEFIRQIAGLPPTPWNGPPE
jgi:hypothetical protein